MKNKLEEKDVWARYSLTKEQYSEFLALFGRHCSSGVVAAPAVADKNGVEVRINKLGGLNFDEPENLPLPLSGIITPPFPLLS